MRTNTRAQRAVTTTTKRGLGWDHQKTRQRLLRKHVDGSPCDGCGKPMHRTKELNFDGRVLAADHTIARAHGGTKADRLLHSKCNESRGDGTRCAARPVVAETSRDW